MGRKAMIAGIVVVLALAATVALASGPLRLYVNGVEIRSDVPPLIISGRTMVPIRWIAEELGADVVWDAAENSVSINMDWPKGLDTMLKAAAADLGHFAGDVTAVWRAGGGFLLQHVSGTDYSYYLCDTAGKKDRIVYPIENARLTEITDTEILFTAKGGGDCTAFTFPYRLRYDLVTGTLAHEDLYLRRDLVFGTITAWPRTLRAVAVGDDTVQVALAVAPDTVLAGGQRTPITVARWNGSSLSLRMYGVTCSGPGRVDAVADHPWVVSVQWRPLDAGQEPGDDALLGQDFPYGGMTGPVNRPSVLVTIDLKGSPDFNVVNNAGDDLYDPEWNYTVRFR